MTCWQSKLFVLLIFLGSLPYCCGKDLAEKAILDMDSLRETVNRYFANIDGYQEGDLITQSQVEEFQHYLRKTRGHSAASHRRLLKRVLADESRLVQIFYKRNGADVLRVSAAIKGGYEAFDRLCYTAASHAKLAELVELGAVEKLHQLIDQESKKQIAAKQEKGATTKSRTRPPRIYTIEDYLAAVAKSVEKKASTAQQKSF